MSKEMEIREAGGNSGPFSDIVILDRIAEFL